MSTTQELVERLNQRADNAERRKAGAAWNGMNLMSEEAAEDQATFRAAAASLSELERENARMREALYLASDALRENIAWEADLIMSEREWSDGIPCPTPAMWNKLTDELQHKRNVAAEKVRAALAGEA